MSERLVEQKHLRLVDQNPAQSHPLLLPSRKFRRQTIQLVFQAKCPGRFHDGLVLDKKILISASGKQTLEQAANTGPWLP